jgi:hypothetical protein
VEAAVAPELDPLPPPLLDPELLPLLEPLELDALPELLPLDEELLELPELLDEFPEELPLLLVPPDPLLLPVDEEPLLEPDDPLPPELEPAGVPGDVCPPELEFWYGGVPPPVSLELHAQRQSARAAIAAAVGPVDVRRMVSTPIASTGPCAVLTSVLHWCSHSARSPSADVAVSPGGDVPLDHLRRRLAAQLHLQ